MSDHRLSSGACDGLGRLGAEIDGVDISAGSSLIFMLAAEGGLTTIRFRSAGFSAFDFCLAIVGMSRAGGSSDGGSSSDSSFTGCSSVLTGAMDIATLVLSWASFASVLSMIEPAELQEECEEECE